MNRANAMSVEDIERIERALFFDPPEIWSRLKRFTALILFASVIGSGGLLSGSSATIIGAMLIAPLMTPIMGLVVAAVIGSPVRVGRCGLIILFGMALSIGVGALVGRAMPSGWDPILSREVLARTSPRLLDLVIALAAGGAGAYAMCRADVADALPGVAISISLVPPLNTVGILLAGGYGHLATQALLLFLTNLAAIFLAGGLVFAFMGLGASVGRTPGQFRRTLAAILIFTILITVPLGLNSSHLWTESRRESQALEIVQDWAKTTDWEVYRVAVDGNHVEVDLGGNGPLPPSNDLISQLKSVMGNEMTLTARIASVQRIKLLESTPTS